MLRAVMPLVLLVGCVPEEDSKPAGTIEQGGDTDVETCEGTAPVLEELTVSANGLFTFEGEESPSLKVSGKGTDDDGDLHDMKMTIWWDDVVDGAVDTAGAGLEGGYFQMDPEECGTFTGTYNLVLEVDGSRYDFATTYEFAAVVYDAAGLDSGTPVVASGTTPNEDGSDPG